VLRVRRPDGGEDEILARAVIDASGTWRTPRVANALLGTVSPTAFPMFWAVRVSSMRASVCWSSAAVTRRSTCCSISPSAVQLRSMRIARVQTVGDGVVVPSDDDEAVGPFEEVIGATGFRPDLDVTRELRL
jgi:hypothetical protein